MPTSPITLLRAAAAIALCALLPTIARAQQSFPATHISFFRSASGVADSARGAGVAIFRADRGSNFVDFRLSLASRGGAINDVHLRLRTGTGNDPILQSFVYPFNEITATSSLTVDLPAIFDALDSNRLYLDVRSDDYPEGYMIGGIEMIPNGVANEIEPGQEVPRSDSSDGFGHATMTVDQAAHRARYHVEWRGLTGPATMAHFHLGVAGENGAPIHTIALRPGDTAYDAIWENMSDADIRAVAEGRVYVNVHTARYPNGEIRGQVLPTEIYTAAIEPSNVVPPVELSDATGTAYLVVTTFPGKGTFVRSTAVIGGTLDTITSVDIHSGGITENGPSIFTLPRDGWSTWELQQTFPASFDIPAAVRAALRAGGAYIDIHTPSTELGEARGQFIPSALNLTAASAPAPAPAATATALTASVDRASNTIRFTIGDHPARGTRRIVLYSAIGARVATIDATDAPAIIDASALPSGIYIAQLLVDGAAAGICRVGVVR